MISPLVGQHLPVHPVPQHTLSSNGIQVPAEVISVSGCSNFLLVIRKTLHTSDVKLGKARFTMPKNQLLDENFLNEEDLQ